MALTNQQVKQVVNRYIGVSGGYLGDFIHRTHQESYLEYCGIGDIETDTLQRTTRERFTSILTCQSRQNQAGNLCGVIAEFRKTDDGEDKEIRAGGIQSAVTAVTKILPPISRFSEDRGHGEWKQRVLTRLGAFFECFFGLTAGG